MMLRVLSAGLLVLTLVGCGGSGFEGSDVSAAGARAEGDAGGGDSGGAGSGAAGSAALGSAGSGGAGHVPQCVAGSAEGIPACRCANGSAAHPVCDNEGNFGSCAVACGEKTQECQPGVTQTCRCGPNNSAGGSMLCDADGNWSACTSDLCTQLDNASKQAP